MRTNARVALGSVLALVACAVLWRTIGRPADPGAAVPVLPREELGSAGKTGSRAGRGNERDDIQDPTGIREGLSTSHREEVTEGAAALLDSVVYGTLRTPDGSPPPSVRVEMQSEWGERGSDTTERSESYAISGLHAGRWTIRVRDCPGFFAAAKPIDLGGGSSVRVDIDLLSASPGIAIRLLTSTGEAAEKMFLADRWQGGFLPRVDVVATREPLSAKVTISEIARTKCGTYTPATQGNVPSRTQVPAGFSGLLELDQLPPAYASAILGAQVVCTAPIDEQTRELTLVIDMDRTLAALGSLRFRLLNGSTGEPIDKVGIELYDRPSGKWANPVMKPLDQGFFERLRLPPGEYELQVRFPGFEHLVRTVLIEAGRVTQLGDIVLPEGGAIRGRVLDEMGNGVSVALGWANLDAAEEPMFVDCDRSSSDGGFALAELPAQGALLRISDAEWALDPVVIRPAPGGIDEMVLVAKRGAEVTIRQRLGVDAVLQLLLRRGDGLAIWSARDVGAATHRIRLVQGQYRLEIRKDAALLQTRAITVAAAPLALDLVP